MPGATASGWPYVLPEDHPLQAPAEQSQALATKLETRIPETARLRYKVIAGKTTDASGMITITAAEMGLATITGAVAALLWGAAIDGLAPSFCEARVATSASVQIRIYSLNAPATGGTVRLTPAGTAVTVDVIAWGT